MNKFYRLLRYDWPLHFVLLFTNWLPDNVLFIRFRGSLASPFFKKCGKKLGLGRNVIFYNPSNISIGSDVYIATGCWFSAGKEIVIGEEVLFGPYNVVASTNHTLQDGSYRYGIPVGAAIKIGKGSWIGGHCTILQGVVIGSSCLVAANSVVNKPVSDNSIVGGNPATFIKSNA